MRPPAPGLLSTTICCFQIWVRRSATTRVATSGLLPAAAGVMNVTGLVGYSCACADRLATMAMAATHIAPNLSCRIRIGRSSRTGLHTYASGRLPGRRHQQVSSIRERSERGRSEKARFLNAIFAPLSMAAGYPAQATPGCAPASINTMRTRPHRQWRLEGIQKGGGDCSECNKRTEGLNVTTAAAHINRAIAAPAAIGLALSAS